MLSSVERQKVETLCEAGVESYISSKHKEHMVEGFEAGLVGAFIGTILTLGVSYSGFAPALKPNHALFPAFIGFSSAVIASYTTMKNDDDDHREDYKKVCENYAE